MACMKVVFVGAGNVASSLAPAMQQVETFDVVQVYSRTKDNARLLAEKLGCGATDDMSEIRVDADLYVYALTDSALPHIISQIHAPEALHIHTAGSIGLDIFDNLKPHCGVMYPFQTFSRNRNIPLAGVPLFIEARNEADCQRIRDIAQMISGRVFDLNTENRKWLHLAGVFANNFSNSMFHIACQLIERANLPYDVLLPLMNETVNKLNYLDPQQAQTGPAARGDEEVMNYQASLLDSPLRQIYQLQSDYISLYISQKKVDKP